MRSNFRSIVPIGSLRQLLTFVWVLAAPAAHAGFVYEPIDEDIVSAHFSADFAALVAHKTIAGEQVNMLMLMGGNGMTADLTDAFFGAAELLDGDMPAIDQGPLETGVVSVDIPGSFFPVLASGEVGLWFLATDTDDGLFAIDYLALSMTTTSRTLEFFIDENDGFDIGLADGAALPDVLPNSIPVGASGTGFDEAISSKAHHNPVPEPPATLLVLAGMYALNRCRRRA